MGSAVYVWPLHLIGGVYADLHGPDNAILRPYGMLPGPVSEDGNRKLVTLEFDIANARNRDGPIRIKVSGTRCTGGDGPERSAVIKMVEALRTEYGIFPLDYNYIVLSEKRALYNAMNIILSTFRGEFGELESVVQDCQTAYVAFLEEISVWLAQDHPKATFAERTAVGGLYTSMHVYLSEFRRDTIHAGDLVEMMMMRDVVPDEQRQLDMTVPMPMVIDWEGSYCTLRTIYNEAVTKINGVVHEIRVIEYNDGLYKASVETSADPHIFWGASAESPLAAKAKLLFTVIKYVNKVLFYDIMDLHFVVRMHEEDFINRFDNKMSGIWRCGQKLQSMLYFVQELFDRNAGNFVGELSGNPSSFIVHSAVELFGAQIVSLRQRFDECWGRFMMSHVDRQMVQDSLREDH